MSNKCLCSLLKIVIMDINLCLILCISVRFLESFIYCVLSGFGFSFSFSFFSKLFVGIVCVCGRRLCIFLWSFYVTHVILEWPQYMKVYLPWPLVYLSCLPSDWIEFHVMGNETVYNCSGLNLNVKQMLWFFSSLKLKGR